jgi:hypothetical protein
MTNRQSGNAKDAKLNSARTETPQAQTTPNYNFSRLDQSGFSLVEVLVAFALLILVFNFLADTSMVTMDLASKEMETSTRSIENDELARLISNPIYFGLLLEPPKTPGEVSLNQALIQCATADGIDCDADKSYPLTPIDAETRTALVSASGTLDKDAINEVTFKIHCPDHKATSCGEAQSFTVTIETKDKPGVTPSRKRFRSAPIKQTVFVKPESKHVAKLTPDTKIAPGRPIEVVLLIDTSNSMTDIRDKVYESIDKLLGALSDMDLNLRIESLDLTTSQFVTERYSIDPITDKHNSNIAPPIQYFYEKVLISPDMASTEKLTSITGWENLSMDDFLKSALVPFGYRNLPRIFKFRSTDTEAARNATRKLIQWKFSNEASNSLGAIAKAQSNGGFYNQSTEDNTLCGALRTIDFRANSSPTESIDKTPLVLILVSNGNDDSLMKNCIKAVTVRIENVVYPRHNDMSIKLTRLIGSYDFTGVTVDRGRNGYIASSIYKELTKLQSDPFRPRNSSLYPIRQFADHITIDLLPNSKQTCIDVVCKDTLQKPFCNKYGDPTIKECFISFEEPKHLSSLNKRPPYATCAESETWFRTNYAGYSENSCVDFYLPSKSGKEIDYTYSNPSYFFDSNSDIYKKDDFPTAILNSVKSTIGLRNFYYLPIIHSASEACPMEQGGQKGIKYETLYNMLDIKQKTMISICGNSNDYSKGLSNIEQFKQSLAVDDFELKPQWVATLTGVEVKRGDQILTPAKGVDYQIIGNNLIFTTGYIQPSDKVLVHY